jgi:hypothetical protein
MKVQSGLKVQNKFRGKFFFQGSTMFLRFKSVFKVQNCFQGSKLVSGFTLFFKDQSCFQKSKTVFKVESGFTLLNQFYKFTAV